MATAAQDEEARPVSGEVTVDELLDVTGEEEVGDIREVALRERGLTDIPRALQTASELEVLSLSHNQLTSAQSLCWFGSLKYVNLNFNSLTSIDGIQYCRELRHLFLANNQIRELEPLASCPRLQAVSLFRNHVADLNAALMVFDSLPDLERLDFENNPATTIKAYRHQLVRRLPRVTELDGEEVTPLDRELAEQYAASEGLQPLVERRHAGKAPLNVTVPTSPSDPRASSDSLRSPVWGGETPRDLAPAPEESSTALPQRPMTAPTLLTAVAASAADALSSDRLFSNNFLNQHPVLMEYMSQAESQRDALFMDDEGGPVATSAAHRPPARPRASLAHRLRATTAVMTARGSMDVHELAELEREGVPQGYTLEEAVMHLPADNPQQVMRRLLRVCEMLRRQRDACAEGERRAMAALDQLSRSQRRGRHEERTLGESDGGGDGDHHEEESSGESGSPSPPRKGVPLTMREAEELARTTEALVLENKHLRAENKNMFFLFEENKDLREEVQHLRLKVEELKKRTDGIKEARQSSLSAQHMRPTSHPGGHEPHTTTPPLSSHRRTRSQGRSRTVAAASASASAAHRSLAHTHMEEQLEHMAMAAALDEQPLMRSDSDPADSLGDSNVGPSEETLQYRQSSRARHSSAESEGGADVAPNREVAAAGVATSRRPNAIMGALPRRTLPKGTEVTG